MIIMNYHIGCSGWSYKEWKGDFYPEDLPASKWFEYYAKHFNTVELNNTFYRLPTENAVKNWHGRSPEGFQFSAKASQHITHYQRLKDIEDGLAKFYASLAGLKNKLGPVLFQLPASVKRDGELLENFLSKLPKTHAHVMELRSSTWWEKEVYGLLEKYSVGFCIYHREKTTSAIVTTSDNLYLRFHGTGARYTGSYDTKTLKKWAKIIKESGAKDAWVYFNNSAKSEAPMDALSLRKILEK